MCYRGVGSKMKVGAHFRREAPEKFCWGPHFSSGPPHFNSMKLKWGAQKINGALKTAHLQMSNNAWYLWEWYVSSLAFLIVYIACVLCLCLINNCSIVIMHNALYH